MLNNKAGLLANKEEITPTHLVHPEMVQLDGMLIDTTLSPKRLNKAIAGVATLLQQIEHKQENQRAKKKDNFNGNASYSKC